MMAFFDIDTQNDFMNADGGLYVPGAEQLKPNLSALTLHAQKNNIPLLGSLDMHLLDDPEFEIFPPHCIIGTEGSKKIAETYLEKTVYIDKEDIHPRDIGNLVWGLKNNDFYGMYFKKQHFDIFTNPHTERFLKELGITRVVVYGVATEYCVKTAVMGLLKRGYDVQIVEDAIAAVDPESSALSKMVEAGAKPVKTTGVLSQ